MVTLPFSLPIKASQISKVNLVLLLMNSFNINEQLDMCMTNTSLQ